jgi:hypothetical protein
MLYIPIQDVKAYEKSVINLLTHNILNKLNRTFDKARQLLPF